MSSKASSTDSDSSTDSSKLVSKVLYSISKTDLELVVTSQKKVEILSRQDSARKEIKQIKDEITSLESKHQQLKARLEVEEERLSSEQKKIVERRKQLTALGGTKGAKLVEREIDIAARTLQTMEQRTIQALEESEGLTLRLDEKRKILAEKEIALESTVGDEERALSSIIERIKELSLRKNQALEELDERIRTLYSRILVKYPGGAVVVAESGTCRGCFRTLPVQLYNQVLSGNLLQCPDCNRILIAPVIEEE